MMTEVTIVEFLLARIEEDEALARSASPGPWHVDAESTEVLAVDGIVVADGFALSGKQTRATTAHIARHDPAHVLTECEAKRQVISIVASWRQYRQRQVLQPLASVYADHPDYRDEWRPSVDLRT